MSEHLKKTQDIRQAEETRVYEDLTRLGSRCIYGQDSTSTKSTT